MTATALPPSPRTRVRRVAELASYEQTALHAILDAAYLCHIAFRDDKGSHCIPTACWRIGGHLYIHGSNGTVLRIALDECAVKQRTGGPLDDAGDMAHAVWTGELPFTHGRGAAIADALNTCELPPYAAAWGTESA